MDTILNWIRKLLPDPTARFVESLNPIVARINQIEADLISLSDEALAAKTEAFRERIRAGATLEDLLPEAFATVREAGKRMLGMRHFDAQLVGGMVLHAGKIAEMKTGEGKTLVATLPAYLNALAGQGVYIVTVNDYLARRDSEWMGKVFRLLSLTVGVIQADMSPEARIEAYACDITYGTNNEYGFDYLRDHLAWDADMVCQKRRHFAIVDEVDSILIDEARTPLIISGPVQDSTERYIPVSEAVRKLEKEIHFTVDAKHKNVILTDAGIEKLEEIFGVTHLYSTKNIELAHMAVQCLKALHVYTLDIEYVVKDGEIVIVDEFTGRMMVGRRFSDGLHQAIEAMEKVEIREESQTLASVTFQNYFRMFSKLSGMTGTAATEADEFIKIYGLEVCKIPSNRPVVRQDLPDLVYKSKVAKYDAIAVEVAALHAKGTPVLVGTISIETSETISKRLTKAGIPHNVLNAKFHEKEAEIVAKAGQKGAVTIATNMAGRGTDIVLGEGVKELGGLCVIGSERHESRRIDNQLRGRSGRQGDPGSSRFYVALDDELMRLFGSDRIASLMERFKIPDDTPIEHSLVTRSIERAQSKVERYHFGVRKQILQYDDVINRQRDAVYRLRMRILNQEDLDSVVADWVRIVVKHHFGIVAKDVADRKTLDTSAFFIELNTTFPEAVTSSVFLDFRSEKGVVDPLVTGYLGFYEEKKAKYPDNLFEAAVVKRSLLFEIDRKWTEHLRNMDALREGIGLRAYGQRDPVLEYRIEGFSLYERLMVEAAQGAMDIIFKAEIEEIQWTQETETAVDLAHLTADS